MLRKLREKYMNWHYWASENAEGIKIIKVPGCELSFFYRVARMNDNKIHMMFTSPTAQGQEEVQSMDEGIKKAEAHLKEILTKLQDEIAKIV